MQQELQRVRQPPRPVGFAVAAARGLDVAQQLGARLPPPESLSHEEAPEPAGVAQRARAFLRSGVEIDPPAERARALNVLKDPALTEPERRAHRGGAPDDGRAPG